MGYVLLTDIPGHKEGTPLVQVGRIWQTPNSDTTPIMSFTEEDLQQCIKDGWIKKTIELEIIEDHETIGAQVIAKTYRERFTSAEILAIQALLNKNIEEVQAFFSLSTPESPQVVHFDEGEDDWYEEEDRLRKDRGL